MLDVQKTFKELTHIDPEYFLFEICKLLDPTLRDDFAVTHSAITYCLNNNGKRIGRMHWNYDAGKVVIVRQK